MIAYLRDHNRRKTAVFTALGSVAGGARGFWIGPLSLRNFPETAQRLQTALSRAKSQPRTPPLGWLKRQLVRLQYNGARRWFARNPGVTAVAWNGLGGSRQAFLMGAKDAGAPTLFAELAPLPGRVTLDPQGVNAESSVPQDPAYYSGWAETHDTGQWRSLGQGLRARPSRRADVGQGGDMALPDAPFIFCPLQVPQDSQVTLFSGWCGGMVGFLAALDQAARLLPPGWHLRLKEHPSAKTPLSRLIAPLLGSGRVVLDNQTDSFTQIAAARAIVTLNSSMGLQAFFHDKPVIALGRAFWAIEGLATSIPDQTRLNAVFASPEAIAFDPALRAAFVTWLGAEYYPAFSPDPLVFDHRAFAAKLVQAKALSPARPMR